MRELKFRYWWEFKSHTITQVFSIGQIESDAVNDFICSDDFPSYPLTGGKDQFTGLTDKDGVDIYEGDIVKAVSNQHYWLSVISSEGSGIEGNNLYAMEFCNNLSESEFGDEWTFKKQPSTRRNTVNKGMEVIGNIHQHPELLK